MIAYSQFLEFRELFLTKVRDAAEPCISNIMGKIQRDQLEDYAQRKGMSLDEME
jgi:hypothetical protein